MRHLFLLFLLCTTIALSAQDTLWQPLALDIPVTSLGPVITLCGKLYTAVEGQVFSSTDGGETWTPIEAPAGTLLVRDAGILLTQTIFLPRQGYSQPLQINHYFLDCTTNTFVRSAEGKGGSYGSTHPSTHQSIVFYQKGRFAHYQTYYHGHAGCESSDTTTVSLNGTDWAFGSGEASNCSHTFVPDDYPSAITGVEQSTFPNDTATYYFFQQDSIAGEVLPGAVAGLFLNDTIYYYTADGTRYRRYFADTIPFETQQVFTDGIQVTDWVDDVLYVASSDGIYRIAAPGNAASYELLIASAALDNLPVTGLEKIPGGYLVATADGTSYRFDEAGTYLGGALLTNYRRISGFYQLDDTTLLVRANGYDYQLVNNNTLIPLPQAPDLALRPVLLTTQGTDSIRLIVSPGNLDKYVVRQTAVGVDTLYGPVNYSKFNSYARDSLLYLTVGYNQRIYSLNYGSAWLSAPMRIDYVDEAGVWYRFGNSLTYSDDLGQTTTVLTASEPYQRYWTHDDRLFRSVTTDPNTDINVRLAEWNRYTRRFEAQDAIPASPFYTSGARLHDAQTLNERYAASQLAGPNTTQQTLYTSTPPQAYPIAPPVRTTTTFTNPNTGRPYVFDAYQQLGITATHLYALGDQRAYYAALCDLTAAPADAPDLVVCAGETVIIDGDTVRQSLAIDSSFVSPSGCASTSFRVQFVEALLMTDTTVCRSPFVYTTGGSTYVTAQDSVLTTDPVLINGCPQRHEFTVDIETAVATRTVRTCDEAPIELYGQLFGPGTHTFSHRPADGCDTTFTYTVAPYSFEVGRDTVFVVPGTTVNGQVFDAPGATIVTFPAGNSVGCDSTLVLWVDLLTSTRDAATANAPMVYPTLFNTTLHVSFGAVAGATRLRLYDAYGREWEQRSFSTPTFRFEVKPLPPGVYFLHIERGGTQWIERVVRE